ncbi:hypothetical protein IM697_22995 [Streptomyces ferrugineus]|uniref:Uncharacterized protein n=1 Tax=Streptomyces ferrugineus TaxID=1413221 RepID=A0A7M2SCL3_9ACTN|nr:hypothetical protein [Streptomyces ferrugineus]QOV33133.1 hypothetical protein IM697_22995 [Streptomyces ferrugineus]
MNTLDPAITLETVEDVSAIEGLAEALYDWLGNTEQTVGCTLEEFREGMSASEHAVTVIAWKAGAVVGWADVFDPAEEEGTTAKHVVIPTESVHLDVCRSLLQAARVLAGPAGLQWDTDNGPAQRQLAAELGAVSTELGDHVWQASVRDRPALAELTGLPEPMSVRALSDPPTDEELAQYARLYTAAGEPRCADGCTAVWDSAAIADMLAERDPDQLSFLLEDSAGIRAEVTVDVDVVGGSAGIWPVHGQVAADELAVLIATALEEVRVRHPHVQSVRTYVPDTAEVISAGLAGAGFTAVGRDVCYRFD